MNIRTKTHRLRGSRRAWLYSLIYASRISVLTVLFLFASFLVQPFHQAFANESVTDDLPQEDAIIMADPVAEQEDLDETSAADESVEFESLPVDTEANEVDTEADVSNSVAETDTVNSEVITDLQEEANTEPEPEIILDEGDEDADSLAVSSTEVIDDSVNIGTSGDTSEGSSDTKTSGDENSVTTDDEDITDEQVKDEEQGEEGGATVTAVTEETVAAPTTTTAVQAENLLTEDNYYQFSRQSCVSIGDGTYHCSTKTAPGVDTNSVVYAERDVDGDLEIFLRTAKGDIEQLTKNSLDDSSPYLDVESLKIVWHRLINDRYQIILYDLESKKETQLTFSRTNNMEPKVSKDGVVWQAWDNNDWEIMFFDGNYTDQLTSNTAQDVTPVIKDGYILWSVLGNKAQEAMVYSLKTGQTMTIADHEGGSIVNPRFVLVYDTKFDNGDIITQGFDPATGLSAPIAATPAPEPIDIPNTDSTGEVRALIQNKSTQKEKEVVIVPTDPDSTEGLGLSSSTTATSTDTLDLRRAQTDPIVDDMVATTTRPANASQDFELTDYDLVITPYGSSTTTGSTVKE